MLAVAYTKSVPAAIVCLSFGVGIGGFAWAGFSVNHLDIAPQVCVSTDWGIHSCNGTLIHVFNIFSV